MSTFFISMTTIVGLLSNKSQLIAFWVGGGFRNATWLDFKLVAVVRITGFAKEVITRESLKEIYGIDVKLQLSENKKYPICVDYELIRKH